MEAMGGGKVRTRVGDGGPRASGGRLRRGRRGRRRAS